jgi:hypothetical protein
MANIATRTCGEATTFLLAAKVTSTITATHGRMALAVKMILHRRFVLAPPCSEPSRTPGIGRGWREGRSRSWGKGLLLIVFYSESF